MVGYKCDFALSAVSMYMRISFCGYGYGVIAKEKNKLLFEQLRFCSFWTRGKPSGQSVVGCHDTGLFPTIWLKYLNIGFKYFEVYCIMLDAFLYSTKQKIHCTTKFAKIVLFLKSNMRQKVLSTEKESWRGTSFWRQYLRRGYRK